MGKASNMYSARVSSKSRSSISSTTIHHGTSAFPDSAPSDIERFFSSTVSSGVLTPSVFSVLQGPRCSAPAHPTRSCAPGPAETSSSCSLCSYEASDIATQASRLSVSQYHINVVKFFFTLLSKHLVEPFERPLPTVFYNVAISLMLSRSSLGDYPFFLSFYFLLIFRL